MSYLDICILGWNLNALMFVTNLLLAVRVIRANNVDEIEEQTRFLEELKFEFDKYYPNRKIEIIISYLVPFTAFFRMTLRLLEMFLFFTKNKNTTMYDFMVYKYSYDIQKAKSK
ncbi:MAG: hypothetical protein C0626_02695 [Arcobacter sp.]|uniref:hypothetical protein n=1 Tax=uncultured Arcobacter sp. TaxID=165434 RepID=UPI000CB8F941|nr:hypothetical protein [uncultured Arcobacter sp.]PLY11488.1 MAG: hypothetical protein C0626_02695 [Arcobacter sp.]